MYWHSLEANCESIFLLSVKLTFITRVKLTRTFYSFVLKFAFILVSKYYFITCYLFTYS